MKLTKRIQKAIDKACRLHLNQVRKADESRLPYVSHPFSVAWILSGYTDDEDTIIAGLLHDVLEDVAGYCFEDLVRDFGAEAAGIVKELTEDKDPNAPGDSRATWKYRKEKYLRSLEHDSEKTLMVCAADKMHNLQSMVEAHGEQGDKVWKKFNASPDQLLWFYEEVQKVLERRLHSHIVRDYEKELQRLKSCLNQH
jgi:(p)ppGpp synthase/HD superfamily hydrolase